MHLQRQKFRNIRKLKKWFNFKYEVVYFYNVEKDILKQRNGDCDRDLRRSV